MATSRESVESSQPLRSPILGGRLNVRLLAWFLVFSLAPLLVTNAVGYQRSETIISGLVENYLTAIAQVQSQHVSDRIDHNLSLLEAITAGNDFLAAGAIQAGGRNAGQMGTAATRTAISDYLAQKLRDLLVFQALALTTLDGRVIASAGPVQYLATTPPGEAGAAITAGIRRGSDGAQPVFRLAVPVRRGAESPVGYLTAAVAMIGSGDFLQIPAHLAGRVESFIVDEGGWPLFVSHPHGPVNYTASLMSPLVSMPPGGHAHYRDADGVDVIGTVATVPDHPWRFIAQVPAADVLGPLRELRTLSLVLELVFVALLVATAFFVARDIVAPLHRLVAATRRVGEGDLDVRVSVRERDEVGELGRAFNEMTSALADTTARVRQLHQREIERASQLATVGELASGVAHEIRNPVVGVSNGLDLVRRRVGDDPTLVPIIDEMGRQLSRIGQTLQGLLAFARPATPTLAPVSGNNVVERAVRLVRPAAQHADVTINVGLAPDLPRLLVDEEMLYQALVNVLMNAVEATPAGGQIHVRTRQSDGDLVIGIADTGRGIPAADLEHVFKPFFTTRHTGTGLGLPISREIVQRHAGQLTLESRDGEGTTVSIRLPLHPPDDATASSLATTAALQ
jgi:signal transduction histidine kinase